MIKTHYWTFVRTTGHWVMEYLNRFPGMRNVVNDQPNLTFGGLLREERCKIHVSYHYSLLKYVVDGSSICHLTYIYKKLIEDVRRDQ